MQETIWNMAIFPKAGVFLQKLLPDEKTLGRHNLLIKQELCAMMRVSHGMVQKWAVGRNSGQAAGGGGGGAFAQKSAQN
jgi:hypothetical protein